jgi:hypothetical protein
MLNKDFYLNNKSTFKIHSTDGHLQLQLPNSYLFNYYNKPSEIAASSVESLLLQTHLLLSKSFILRCLAADLYKVDYSN